MTGVQDFRHHADETIVSLYRLLTAAAEDYGFDARLAGGAVTVKCRKSAANLVITANPASHQILVSMGSKSYKLDWDIVEAAFILSETGQTLKEVVEQALGEQLGGDVSL